MEINDSTKSHQKPLRSAAGLDVAARVGYVVERVMESLELEEVLARLRGILA